MPFFVGFQAGIFKYLPEIRRKMARKSFAAGAPKFPEVP
jgi:hypothetical protein